MKYTLNTLALASLIPATSWAHSGHPHTQGETLSGMLHTLMTNPMLFAVVGLLLAGALLYKRQ